MMEHFADAFGRRRSGKDGRGCMLHSLGEDRFCLSRERDNNRNASRQSSTFLKVE
jgi:hypothetical protein